MPWDSSRSLMWSLSYCNGKAITNCAKSLNFFTVLLVNNLCCYSCFCQLKEQGGAMDVFIEARLSACGKGKCWSVIFQKHLSISESPGVGPSVVVHTTVTFGSEHLDSDPTEVQQLILSHLERIMPSLPKLASITCQKWRYSQVLCAGISQLEGCCWGNSVKQACSLLQETGH